MIAHYIKRILRDKPVDSLGETFDNFILSTKRSWMLMAFSLLLLYLSSTIAFAAALKLSSESGPNRTNSCIAHVESASDYLLFSFLNLSFLAELTINSSYDYDCTVVYTTVLLEKCCGIAIYLLFIIAAFSLKLLSQRKSVQIANV